MRPPALLRHSQRLSEWHEALDVAGDIGGSRQADKEQRLSLGAQHAQSVFHHGFVVLGVIREKADGWMSADATGLPAVLADMVPGKTLFETLMDFAVDRRFQLSGGIS